MMYTDPNRDAYNAMGASYGVGELKCSECMAGRWQMGARGSWGLGWGGPQCTA